MKVVLKSIKNIKPYKNNPRQNDEAVNGVMESIREFGFKIPIIIDSNDEIIAGHTRYKASIKLGLDEMPCIVADDLSAEQIRAFRLADNKVAEAATWDMDLLLDELKGIGDIDMDLFGFDVEDDLVSLEEVKETPIPESADEVDIKQGDIFILGNHRLMCGDSTNEEHINALIENEVDIMVTDPPYNVDYEGATEDALKISNDNMAKEDFQEFLSLVFILGAKHLKPGGAFYIWYALRSVREFLSGLSAANLEVRQELTWVKNNFVIGRSDYQWITEPCIYGWKAGAAHKWYGGRKQTTVLEFDKPTANREHPTMKPVALISKLITNSSKKGDIVLDMFGGSGTTLIAAEQLGRTCYMMEYDPKYVDVIIRRWEELTGDTARKVK